MWKIAGAIYTESGYFNLEEVEAAYGVQVWGPAASNELKEGCMPEAPAFYFPSSFLFPPLMEEGEVSLSLDLISGNGRKGLN